MIRKITVVIKWEQSSRQVKKGSDKTLPTQYKPCGLLLIVAVLYYYATGKQMRQSWCDFMVGLRAFIHLAFWIIALFSTSAVKPLAFLFHWSNLLLLIIIILTV